MSSIAVDNPDLVIDWFATYPDAERKRRPAGNCPHACEHRMLSVVAWGPSLTHYELRICTDDGCQGNCRGWCAPATYDRLCAIDWKLLGG
jgi:hypothetical protein